MESEIRSVRKEDIGGLKSVLDTLDLFPSEMLDDMIADYLDNPKSQDLWFTAIENEEPISIGYCAPEQLAEGTFNLYAIGVRSDFQSRGTGKAMMVYVENRLKESGHRILIVETSGADEFKQTRTFYEKLNYTKESLEISGVREMTKSYTGRG